LRCDTNNTEAVTRVHGVCDYRDLKTLNLLVTHDWQIKVADFGLARANTNSNRSTLARLCGAPATLGWSEAASSPFAGAVYSNCASIESDGRYLHAHVHTQARSSM
jgi:serine/threonine protein kinase